MIYRVKDIRKSKGMTQEDLAAKSGVSRTIIVALESGEEVTTTTKTIFKIANALGVTVDEIFFNPSV
jgi:transcriptional regulator with XRE-family HTH domain